MVTDLRLAVRPLPKPLPRMIDFFHPSRYNVNVNVGKLTWPMFSRVFDRLRALLRE